MFSLALSAVVMPFMKILNHVGDDIYYISFIPKYTINFDRYGSIMYKVINKVNILPLMPLLSNLGSDHIEDFCYIYTNGAYFCSCSEGFVD